MIIDTSIKLKLPGVMVLFMLGLAYSTLLWIRKYPKTSRGRVAVVIGLWIVTMIYWWTFDVGMTVVVLIFYLIGYSALRLPGKLSVWLAASIIAADALIFFICHVSPSSILLYSIEHSGLYLLLWGARTRREATKANQRYYEELRDLHEQLAQAHKALQHTYQELEDASVKSLRYAVLEERTRIARDLHDSIGHGLTSVIVQLQALPYMIKSNSTEADSMLQGVLEVARHCLQEVRTVVHDMAVDDVGIGLVALKSLIKQVQAQSRLQIHFVDSPHTGQWKPEQAELLYRVLQEALTNVIRHAEAAHVHVSLTENEKEIRMTVRDDGIYKENSPLRYGFGLWGMKARCESVGGSFMINPCEPNGMELIIKVPFCNSPKEEGQQ